MGSTPRDKPSDLKPIDWERVEADYRAGILSQQEMGKKHGCSHTAIQKRAKKHGWSRDLAAKIRAKAEELVAKNAVAAQVANDVAATRAREKSDADSVLVNGAMLAAVRLSHREDIARGRKLAVALLGELEATVLSPDLFAMVHGALSAPDEPALDALREMAAVVGSLPVRSKVMKELADTLHKLIGAEREAFGLDTASGTDGRPLVIIKDYTGRGDPNAPARLEASS